MTPAYRPSSDLAEEARPPSNGTLSRTPFPDERVKAEVPRRYHRGHPAWSPSAFGLEDNSRQVVLKRVPGEVAYGVEQGVEDGIGRFSLVRPNDAERALQPELLPLRGGRLHDPIGKQQDQFPRLQGG